MVDLRGPCFMAILLAVWNQAYADESIVRRNLFPLQSKHVHSSSFVQLANGDLFACWYHGSGERKANDVVIQAARFDYAKQKWGQVHMIADTPGMPDCNPVLFFDTKKQLWLFWIIPIANRWERSVLKYRRAETFDERGMPVWSWQNTIHLVPGEAFAKAVESDLKKMNLEEDLWAEYALPYSRQLVAAAKDPVKRQLGWMPRIHPTVLPSGRILLPLYSDGFNISLVAISDDDGVTWRASRPIVGAGPIQPTIVRKTNGHLVAYFRDAGAAPHRVQTSLSTDDGQTWSIATDTAIPNPSSSLEVLRLRNGQWAMVYNDTEQKRHRLSVAFSKDEGNSWGTKQLIENDPSKARGFSYPSMIQTQDGQLHVTYSYAGPDGASIRHAVLPLDETK